MRGKEDGFLPFYESAYDKANRIAIHDGPTREELDIFKNNRKIPLKERLLHATTTVILNIQLFPIFNPMYMRGRHQPSVTKESLENLSYPELEQLLKQEARKSIKKGVNFL